jgi:hypothetical protein
LKPSGQATREGFRQGAGRASAPTVIFLDSDISPQPRARSDILINRALDNFKKFLDHPVRLKHSTTCRRIKIQRALPWRDMMKRRTGSPRIYLASSGPVKMPAANSEQRLRSLLETLEECRAILMDKASLEPARLLSLAILELRMELHKVTDSELKALCDLMVPEDEPPPPDRKEAGLRLPPYLKLIK